MKRVAIAIPLIFILIIVILPAICFTQQLVDFDKNSKTCYLSESAWYYLPMTGTASKTELLKKMNLPPGWKIRGMYTNKLLAEIRWNGEIVFKD